MLNLYYLIIILIGFTIYIKKKGYIPCYILIVQTLCLPLVAFFANASDSEEVLEAYDSQTATVNKFMLLITIVDYIIYKQKSDIYYKYRYSFLALVSLLFVSLMWCVFHDDYEMNFMWEQRSFLFLFLLVFYIFINKQTTCKMIFFTLFVILSVEIITAFVNQFFGIYLYTYQYINLTDFSGLWTSGTFNRFNTLANYLVVMQAIISSEYLIKRNISRNYFYLFTILIGIIILYTGSRNGLVTFFLALVIPSFMFYKKNKSFVTYVVLISIAFYSLIMSISLTTSSHDAENGIERILFGLSEKLNEKKRGQSESTDDMTYYLIDKYFDFNPLGQGKTANRTVENAYGNALFLADSMLAFYLVEYGWLYFIVLILFLFTLCKAYGKDLDSKNRKSVYIIFIISFIQSLTDLGLFYPSIFLIIGLYAFYCNAQAKCYKYT